MPAPQRSAAGCMIAADLWVEGELSTWPIALLRGTVFSGSRDSRGADRCAYLAQARGSAVGWSMRDGLARCGLRGRVELYEGRGGYYLS